MAPSADMFEMGARSSAEKGTLFPMRAQKLFDIYNAYNAMEEIPAAVRQELETKIFKRPMEQIWQDTRSFFEQRSPT